MSNIKKLDWYWRSGGAALNENLQTWLDRLTTRGYAHPSSSQITKYNRLFNSGLLDLTDIAYMFSQNGQEETGWVNLPTPESFEITKIGTVNWASNDGETGDGSTGVLNTNWNALSNGVNFTQNNNSFGVWVRDDSIQASKSAMGAWRLETTGQGCYLNPRNTSDIFRAQNNNGSGASIAGATSSIGLTSCVRVSSTEYQIYKNGVAAGSPVSATSAAIVDLVWYICGHRQTTNPGGFYGNTIAFAYAGSGNINQLDLYNELAFFLT